MGSSAGMTSTGTFSSPLLRGVARPYRKVSFITVATIHKSCSHKIGPPTVSMDVGRECHHYFSDSSIWGSTEVLHEFTIITFCHFPTDNANLMVSLHAQTPPFLLSSYSSCISIGSEILHAMHISGHRRGWWDPSNNQVSVGLRMELMAMWVTNKRINRARWRKDKEPLSVRERRPFHLPSSASQEGRKSTWVAMPIQVRLHWWKVGRQCKIHHKSIIRLLMKKTRGTIEQRHAT